MSGGTLLLCHRLPYPPNKGDKIRSFALLKHLAARGPVHLACFIDDAADYKYRDEVRKLAGGKCLFVPAPRSAKWRSAARALLTGQPVTTAFFSSAVVSRWLKDIFASEKIANTVIFGSAMAPYLFGDEARSPHVLFDMVDVDSDKWRQYASSSSGPLRWIYAREAATVFNLERQAARAFGRTLLVSPFEAGTFRHMAPESAEKIHPSNNGVDLDYFSPGPFESPFPAGELAIVMTGRMDYRPNADGARWFAEQVAPHIFSKLPNAHVYFVGSNPPSALRRLNGPKITVTGAVKDIRPYIHSAAVIVAPLRIARGVQNKVLEAMAMHKPVVATHEATRALQVVSGEHLWIENDPARFASAVMTAIQSPTRQSVVERARRYVEQNHNWNDIFAVLDRDLDRLAQKQWAGEHSETVADAAAARPFDTDITRASA